MSYSHFWALLGYTNFNLKMTELLLEIQRTKKLGDPKYQAELTDGGFTAYVTIPVDGNGKTAQFTSGKIESITLAMENCARKAIDSCVDTYKFNIKDYTCATLDKLSIKYMEIELANRRLEESNRVLLETLAVAQEDNRRLKRELYEMKSRFGYETRFGYGKMRNLRKMKDETKELCDMEKPKQSLVSKKLTF